MSIFLIILAVISWGAAFWSLWRYRLLAPGLSYIALLLISFAKSAEGYPLLPVNNTILTGWLCMTVIVMVSTLLQPENERRSTSGIGYMTIGALVGMVVGLLGFTVSESVGMRYSIMVVAAMAGTFFGYLMFGNTPEGRAEAPGRRNFVGPLLAKGFPIALTVMQLGVALVILVALYAKP